MHEYYRAKMALLIIQSLTEYEQATTVVPIDEEHPLWLALGAFCQILPGKILPQEGRQYWNAMISSANRHKEDAMQCAGKLADWLTNYVRGPRLLISLEECSLILDGDLYVKLDPLGLKILHYLQQHAGRPATLDEIREKAPGCRRDERTLRRSLARLEKQLNERRRRTRNPGERPAARQNIKLINSRPGSGHWLELPYHPVH